MERHWRNHEANCVEARRRCRRRTDGVLVVHQLRRIRPARVIRHRWRCSYGRCVIVVRSTVTGRYAVWRWGPVAALHWWARRLGCDDDQRTRVPGQVVPGVVVAPSRSFEARWRTAHSARPSRAAGSNETVAGALVVRRVGQCAGWQPAWRPPSPPRRRPGLCSHEGREGCTQLAAAQPPALAQSGGERGGNPRASLATCNRPSHSPCAARTRPRTISSAVDAQSTRLH